MSQMNRAYSTFEIKTINDDQRIITGVASSISVDRMDDIVEPRGAVYNLPIPLIWMHDARCPVGNVIAAKVSDKNIEVTCQFTQVDEPPSLKDDLDRAWAMIKAKLVRGLSIGFNPIESTDIEGTWGRRFTSWSWLELSPVTIAANQDASITSIKSADARARAALGLARKTVRLDGPRSLSSNPNHIDPRAALGHTRNGVVRLADPPGASGFSTARPA